MGPGDLDAQRSHVDLASASGHFPPPQRGTPTQQYAPVPNSLQHSAPAHPQQQQQQQQQPSHLSTGTGHGPGSGQPGPSRTLPPPHPTTSPSSSLDLRHQQQAHPASAYSRSYSVDSGSQRGSAVAVPAPRDGVLASPSTPGGAFPPPSAGSAMAHHPHAQVYVEQHLAPNGTGQHPHHGVALVPQPEHYQHAASTTVPMHHGSYAPQYGPGPFTQQPPYEPTPYRDPRLVKKAVRAVQACQQCRQRKQKCDEGRPRCGFCEKESLPCEYKETQPPKQDRSINEILQGIRELQKGMEELRQDRLPNVPSGFRSPKRKRIDRPQSASAISAEYADPMDEDVDEVKTTPHSAISDNVGTKAQSTVTFPPFSSYQHAQQAHDMITAQISGEEVPSAGGIPSDHRTSVTHLATWPGIKVLYAAAGFAERKSVTQYEEDQGDLRVCGVGQTGDGLDERQNDYTAESPASDNSDPIEPEGLWGPSQLEAPLRLDESTVRRLTESYFKHFHILHPFLDRARLKRMLDTFIARYRPEPAPNAASPFAVPALPSDSQHSSSRRSGGSHLGTPHSDSPIPTPDYGRDVPVPARQIEKNITSAIVLLVMALGKIAEHKEFLPRPTRPGDFVPVSLGQTSPQAAPSPSSSVKPSPVTSHATINSSHSPSISELRTESMGRHLSLHEGLASKRQQRNIDVFPGLAYYATATNILDYYVRTKNVPGDSIGQHLHMIWAFLLAGLYMGQLCRPKENFTWIAEACKAWIRLKKRYPDLPLKGQPSLSKDVDLVKFAYWTCLQLDSDIRAELDYKDTGIGQYEENVSFPNGISDDLGREEVQTITDVDMFCYCLQNYLRKTLNRTHTFIYPSEKHPESQPRSRIYGGPKEMLAELSSFREMLRNVQITSDALKYWKDGDDPSAEVNVARVRGKYYGAQYVVLRPFLQHAMYDLEPQPVDLAEIRHYLEDAELPPIKLTNGVADRQNDADTTKRILAAAYACIEAAMHSTVAFDGLGVNSRFILTNIHGTALAQFGNMMVLCAAYTSWLGPAGANFIPRRSLLSLLDRTINLMANLSPLSKVMEDNEKILRCARSRVEHISPPNSERSGPSVRSVQSAHSSFGD